MTTATCGKKTYGLDYIRSRKKEIEHKAKNHRNAKIVGGSTVVFEYGVDRKTTKKTTAAIKRFYSKNKA